MSETSRWAWVLISYPDLWVRDGHKESGHDGSLMQVQEIYENWTKRLDDITAKHEEEQRLQAKKKN